ncbi:MAG TPA: hypothetical protein VG672_08000 [Bryobacteraceae bacterium]|jgi:hypothetical protein|nr:hypothetical protein [Bryobacteraceae bacterium]
MSNRIPSLPIVFAIGLLGLIAAPRSFAITGDWTTVAAACVPDEESAGRYAAEFGAFQFRGANTGTVDARCNVTNPRDDTNNPGWGVMEVTYNDPDGAAAPAQVVVYLRRVHKVTGASSDIVVFNSNAFAAGQQLRSVGFHHAFNFTDYAYYIAFSVRRTVSSLAPKIQRVRLYIAPVG